MRTDFKQGFLDRTGPLVYDVEYSDMYAGWFATVSWETGGKTHMIRSYDADRDKAVADTVAAMLHELNYTVDAKDFE